MKHKVFLIAIVLLHFTSPQIVSSQVVFDLFSPDNKILTHIKIADNIEFEVLYDSLIIIEYSEILSLKI